VSYQFPVTFDQDILLQYREELQWANQEVEMLAITLERSPEEMATVEQIRGIIQDAWMSSVKLDLVPISESLADTLKGLDLLLDWQVYPPAMTEFILLLIDRIAIIAHEVEESRFIDMRKTQAILVGLQFIILAKSPTEITQGIDDAIVSISQEIGATDNEPDTDEVVLFDDGVDLFDDGVDLFEDTTTSPAIVTQPSINIFVPQASLNPLNQAREYIQGFSNESSLKLLGQIADQSTQHHNSHTCFVLELSLAMNILAGKPLDFDSLYDGISLHDIALASQPELVAKKAQLTEADIHELKLHPVKSAKVAHDISDSVETELLVLHHHEHVDGSGYPYGLKGDNISEQGKLAGIVDSFHGVMEQHAGLSERERILKAIIEININCGTHYDKNWVKIFNSLLRDYWLADWRAARQVRIKQVG